MKPEFILLKAVQAWPMTCSAPGKDYSGLFKPIPFYL